jgi:holo-[acyl-carrier protein] synthase
MILGLGTDIVEIDRIRKMIEHRDSAVRFAGRWAAKEAIVKMIGTGFVKGITFHDIEVLPLPSGQPSVQLSGGAAETAAKLGISRILLTISHARDYATATAVGVGAE